MKQILQRKQSWFYQVIFVGNLKFSIISQPILRHLDVEETWGTASMLLSNSLANQQEIDRGRIICFATA